MLSWFQEDDSPGTKTEDDAVHDKKTEAAEADTKENPEAKPEAGGGEAEAEEEEDEDEDLLQNGEVTDRTKAGANDGLPRGLVTWREAVRGAQNAAQLAMAFYILETSVAWDKSIMKASCQVRWPVVESGLYSTAIAPYPPTPWRFG